MKKKKNKTGLDHIKSEEIDNNIELTSNSDYFQPLYIKETNNPDWERLIKNCKALIRSSEEYSIFIESCKRDLNLRNCSFLGDVEDDEEVKIEIHHVFSLHNIVEVIANYLLLKEGRVTSMTLCHEVMKAHFNGIIPVIPVSKTIHELIHAQKIKVHLSQIYGDFGKFLSEYRDGFEATHLAQIKVLLETTVENMLPPDLLILNEDMLENKEDRRLMVNDIIEILSDKAKSKKEIKTIEEKLVDADYGKKEKKKSKKK
jgi:hypothetical protein